MCEGQTHTLKEGWGSSGGGGTCQVDKKFFKLKLIKSYLNLTMSRERLRSLTSTENKMFAKLENKT